MKSVGFRILYDHGIGPFDTDFLPDIIDMRHAGVQMFVGMELPDSFAATLAKQMQHRISPRSTSKVSPTRTSSCSSLGAQPTRWTSTSPTPCIWGKTPRPSRR